MTLALTILSLASSVVAPSDLDRYLYPLAPPQKSPEISVDSAAAPELAEWGEKAKSLATDWFPEICQLLSTQDFKPPTNLKFVFRKGQNAPAYTSGHEISFSVEWVTKHPDDLGMVIHELTHVVQAYPRNRHDTGWLVEGIADYVRWWRYEPEAKRSKIDFTKATYHDAYRTTANWLAWVAKKYDLRLVPALDLSLRKAEDPLPVFEKITGKSPDDLWSEYKSEMSP